MDWQPKIGDKCTRNPQWIFLGSKFKQGQVYTVSGFSVILGVTHIKLDEPNMYGNYLPERFTKVEDDDPIEEI